MAIKAQNIKLNLVPGGIIPVVHVSQYDVDRVLTFTLYDGNNAASLPVGTTASIEGTKPSHHGFSYSATVASNVVTVETTQQMTAEKGTVECKLKLTANTQVIGTALFLMEVEQAGLADDVIISDTELPVYIEAGHQNMLNAEAWAVGTKDGTAVGSGEPQYHNNSKYYAEQASDSANDALESETTATAAAEIAKSWATYSTDINTYGTNTDNAHYWSDQAASKYNDMIAAIGTALNKINSFEALMQLLFGAIYLVTESDDILTTESGDKLIIDY